MDNEESAAVAPQDADEKSHWLQAAEEEVRNGVVGTDLSPQRPDVVRRGSGRMMARCCAVLCGKTCSRYGFQNHSPSKVLLPPDQA